MFLPFANGVGAFGPGLGRGRRGADQEKTEAVSSGIRALRIRWRGKGTSARGTNRFARR